LVALIGGIKKMRSSKKGFFIIDAEMIIKVIAYIFFEAF